MSNRRLLINPTLILGWGFALAILSGCTSMPSKDSGPGPSDPDAPSELTETGTGLKYRILRKSSARTPGPTDTVNVHYRGWLDNGKEFDSSYKRKKPISFPLDGVIEGWTEGLQLVGEGGMIELEIPSKLGYKNRAMPNIPANSKLHFIVELLKVETLEPGPKDPDAPTEFTTTPSGLKYRILRKSDGKKPSVNSTVRVHYRGWLNSGKEFDSSYKTGEPTGFSLNGVIPGWTEGLQLVGEGGMIELEIPAKLGYGPGGNVGIPPNATLHFIVELLQVD